MEVLVFGGTAEGRELVEWLSSLGVCDVVSCTATEYGGELVDGLERVTSLVGPLDAQAKERLVADHDFACIVDATHPYATHVTESIAALAAAHGLPRLRLLRDGFADGPFTLVADVAEAAQAVAARPGNVMLTTGAKDLATFVEAVPDFAERLYARILPVESSIAKAHDLGIPASHIIAMQGPFTVEMNIALMRQFDIGTMVTKASGATGGFQEKIDSAVACGAELIVIKRPDEEEGLSFAEAQAELAKMLGVDVDDASIASDEGNAVLEKPADEASASDAVAKRTVYLVGIGLGDPDTLTIEAVKAIERSDLLIGAARMLEPYADRSCEKLALIKSAEIAEALRASDALYASVLFSGDVGFYSGATALSQKLRDIEGLTVRAVPGISSVVCLCARLLTPWQDVHLVSAHGRECDPVAEVREHAKTFMLTGGKTKARDVCEMLVQAGLGEVIVHVGERLSYEDERIVHGSATELAQQDFLDLAVMLVENPAAPKHEPGKLEA
ncbi:MAG: precorrin-6A reductase [Eggerthellaceae bacterium]|nr:precorrin-6A reductase [Eggerthellaceae bacterium]